MKKREILSTLRTTGTYWREGADGVFILHVDHRRRAIIRSQNAAFILMDGSLRAAEPIEIPDGAVIFEEVERRLGLQRVDLFLHGGQPTLVNWRAMAVENARRG